MTAANAAHFVPCPLPVRVLTLNAGAERVMRGNEADKADELWVGTAYGSGDDDEDLGVYVRLAEPQPVVAELLCAVIGRAVGLPIPEPYLVAVTRATLPQSGLLSGQSGMRLTFASQNVGGADFGQLVRADSSHAHRMLRKWEHLVPVAVFDEWLANADRNFGNIVFAAQSLWLIDHAEALGGSMRRLFSLADLSSDALCNNIGDLIARDFTAAQRQGHLDAARRWLKLPAALSLSQAIRCAGLDRWQTAAEQAELLDFVTHRLALTHTLLCNRLGHPQLSLQPPTASGNASEAAAQSSSSPPV